MHSSKNKSKDSPTKQRTPQQLPGQKNVGIYFAQTKNVIDSSSVMTDSSESDEENYIDTKIKKQDSLKKRKKSSIDLMTKKLIKIRKTFDNNISFANEESENLSEDEKKQIAFTEKISPKKILEDSLSSNIELTIKNNSLSTNDGINDKENILNSQTTDTLEGLDDLFEEEWTYEKDKLEQLDDFFRDDWSYNKENTIDFNLPKRCVIIDIIWEKSEMTLTVKDTSKELLAIIKCYGLWLYTKVEPGEFIIVKAKKESAEEKYWTIDNNFGWIVNQPDILISGTSVVGALFCNRRSVFTEKFRLLENLPFYESGNNFMLTGSLTHELLQTALDQNIKEIKKISALLDDILKSRNAIYMMYSAGISMNDCKNLMRPSVVQIYKFIQRYINGVPPEVSDQNFDGKIEKICDIEENVWLPSLGLKGKIDLTVEVSTKSKNKLFHEKRRILPLEIKTGRASFSSEHQGQLILYTMMMNETGRKVDSGLLLYLRENIMKEIVGSNNVQRDLITLRNNVAYHLTRQPTVVKLKDEENVLPMKFPKPIHHHSCAQCPYNILCCAYLTEEDKKEMDDNHPLKSINEKVTNHLTQKDIDYVIKWVSLMQFEENNENQDISWKDIWTLEASRREKKGSCISNLNLKSVLQKNGKFLHEFQRVKGQENISAASLSNFCEQEYIIISTANRINICSGFVHSTTSTSISIHCEKDITKVYNDTLFHIDKCPSSSLLTHNLSQLGGLLNSHETSTKLRKIVIERQPAKFKTDLPPSTLKMAAEILKELNENQKEAILKTLSADDYILIKGFPGTGKTQTLVAMIELLVKLNKSVLVTAHTNTAIDNLLLRLLECKIDFIRFGSSGKTHPSLYHTLDENVTVNVESPENLHSIYCSKKVVGVTCYGTNHPHLSRRKFDFCIVDESTQVLQPTILRPLYCASKFILVGDPEQLPPIAKNNIARKLGINESLFSRLDSENNSVSLTLQYRMNSCIMNIANKLTYHNQLQIGNESVGNATLPVNNIADFESCEKWVRKTLSLKLKNSAIMLNTFSTHHLALDPRLEESKGINNYWEAAIIMRLIEVLKNLGIDGSSIGIIAPYRAQVRLLRSIIPNIEVNTVDQYQGRDKSVIIYSCSKSISTDAEIAEFDILEDHQRLTVAVTRAKHKLIIIGDLNTLQRFTPFRKLIESLGQEHIYDIKDGEDDFSFDDLLSLLHK